MDVSFECKVSLSKKIRKIIGNSSSRIVIIADNIDKGVGDASMMLSVIDGFIDMESAKKMIGEETSVQLTPLSLKDEVPSNDTVSAIYATKMTKSTSGKKTPVDKIAATRPPEKNEVAHAIKEKSEIETPESFKIHDDSEFKSFVSNFSELMNAINVAKKKDSGIVLDEIEDARERALAYEEKESLESIDQHAYVVNDKYGSIGISDLGITLPLNVPYDLSRVSAKRLSSSYDLRNMIESNMIKIITPSEIGEYIEKATEPAYQDGLEVYSDSREAEEAIASDGKSSQYETIDVGENINDPDEQSVLSGLVNLTPNESENTGNVRVSSHGSTRKVKQPLNIPSSNSHKTIKRK